MDQKAELAYRQVLDQFLWSFCDSLALAGFSVLFVVETDARHSMASDAAVPNVSNALGSERRAA